MFKRFKNVNILLINILIFFCILILFFEFFVLNEFYPLHDELAIVERNTEWQNFLWRNNISNHTLNSFLAVTTKSIIGYNLYIIVFLVFYVL